MLARTLSLLLMTISSLSAFDMLPDRYQVTYGSKQAPIEIVQYYSLSCPHCVALFRDDFPDIKKEYIDTGKICYTFHPVPMDLTTVQLLACFDELSEKNKQMLLGVILEELDVENPVLTTTLLKHAMAIFKKPLANLDNDDFIKNSKAFHAAAEFIVQDDKPTTIPSIQVGDKRVDRSPDYIFLSLMLSSLYEETMYEK